MDSHRRTSQEPVVAVVDANRRPNKRLAFTKDVVRWPAPFPHDIWKRIITMVCHKQPDEDDDVTESYCLFAFRATCRAMRNWLDSADGMPPSSFANVGVCNNYERVRRLWLHAWKRWPHLALISSDRPMAWKWCIYLAQISMRNMSISRMMKRVTNEHNDLGRYTSLTTRHFWYTFRFLMTALTLYFAPHDIVQHLSKKRYIALTSTMSPAQYKHVDPLYIIDAHQKVSTYTHTLILMVVPVLETLLPLSPYNSINFSSMHFCIVPLPNGQWQIAYRTRFRYFVSGQPDFRDYPPLPHTCDTPNYQFASAEKRQYVFESITSDQIQVALRYTYGLCATKRFNQ